MRGLLCSYRWTHTGGTRDLPSFQKGKLSPSQLTCSLDSRPQRPVRQRPGPTAHLVLPAPALHREEGFECPLLARIGIH